MTVTAQQVFDMALVLMDEVTDTGTITSEDLSALKTKAVNILTQLQTELLPLSTNPVIITDLSQNMLLSDRDSLLVLPYGLGAHLLLNENSQAAPFLNQRYEELKSKRKTTSTAITDNYNVLEGMM